MCPPTPCNANLIEEVRGFCKFTRILFGDYKIVRVFDIHTHVFDIHKLLAYRSQLDKMCLRVHLTLQVLLVFCDKEADEIKTFEMAVRTSGM